MEEPVVQYYGDSMRHLICVPWSIEGLHKMAEDLGIKKCWFHNPPLGWPHYDIPKKRLQEILDHPKVKEVKAREIVALLKSEFEQQNLNRYSYGRSPFK